jgi:hypothetical protein
MDPAMLFTGLFLALWGIVSFSMWNAVGRPAISPWESNPALKIWKLHKARYPISNLRRSFVTLLIVGLCWVAWLGFGRSN